MNLINYLSKTIGTDLNIKRQVLFDNQDLPFITTLETNWRVIRNELDHLMAETELSLWQHRGDYSHEWRVGPLIDYPPLPSYRENVERTRILCPETAKIVSQIRGITYATFSMISPHTRIHPHSDSQYIMIPNIRCHLGLQVPKGDCGFSIQEPKSKDWIDVGWENGKCFAFDNAWTHTAWNFTNENRMILIVDVNRKSYIQ